MTIFPSRKISETLLEFAEPLLQKLPDGHSEDELRNVIRLATCVWNACVFDQWHETTEYTDSLKRPFEQGHDQELATINALIARKHHLYNNDPRAVANETIVVRNGKFSLRAEARLNFGILKYRGLVN